MKKCEFDKKGVCHALACFSSRKCGARDEKGHPIYARETIFSIASTELHDHGKKRL